MGLYTEHLESPSGASVPELAGSYFEYVRRLIQGIDVQALEKVVDTIRAARESGASIFVIGNGGSAATASHFATDLGKTTKAPGRNPIRVISLTDNVSWLTALGNDEGYENVFAGQLDNVLSTGDVVIAFSASGNSLNLVRGVEIAKSRGATTIAILGFDGGALRPLVDIAIHVPSRIGAYGPVEDVHMMLQHAISACLAQS